MPEKRPMPLTGEERIEPHPLLGEPVDNFPSRRLRPLLIGWSFLIGVSLLFNLATWNIDTSAYGPWVALVFGIVALAVGWWVMHLWNREVILYERGLTYREGSTDVPFYYDELASIRLRAEQLMYFGGLLRRRAYQVTLTTHAGDVIRLDKTYRRVDQLAEALNQRITDLRRPQIQAALAAGEAIPFTPYLSLTTTGVVVDTENGDSVTLAWDDYTGYAAKQGQLQLMTTAGRVWVRVPLNEIDNLWLLVEYLRAKQGIGNTSAP
jgi:hypothetical protein